MRSAIIFALYSSPMRRMLPSVRSLTLRSAASRSCGSEMLSRAERASAAPSNSSCDTQSVRRSALHPQISACARKTPRAAHLARVQQHAAEGERLVLALKRRKLGQRLGQANAHGSVQRAERRLPDCLLYGVRSAQHARMKRIARRLRGRTLSKIREMVSFSALADVMPSSCSAQSCHIHVKGASSGRTRSRQDALAAAP